MPAPLAADCACAAGVALCSICANMPLLGFPPFWQLTMEVNGGGVVLAEHCTSLKFRVYTSKSNFHQLQVADGLAPSTNSSCMCLAFDLRHGFSVHGSQANWHGLHCQVWLGRLRGGGRARGCSWMECSTQRQCLRIREVCSTS